MRIENIKMKASIKEENKTKFDKPKDNNK